MYPETRPTVSWTNYLRLLFTSVITYDANNYRFSLSIIILTYFRESRRENRDMRLIAVFLSLSLVFSQAFELKDFDFGDHDYKSLSTVFNEVNRKCPDISRIYSLDEKTVEGRDLMVIEFTANKPGIHIAGMLIFLKIVLFFIIFFLTSK